MCGSSIKVKGAWVKVYVKHGRISIICRTWGLLSRMNGLIMVHLVTETSAKWSTQLLPSSGCHVRSRWWWDMPHGCLASRWLKEGGASHQGQITSNDSLIETHSSTIDAQGLQNALDQFLTSATTWYIVWQARSAIGGTPVKRMVKRNRGVVASDTPLGYTHPLTRVWEELKKAGLGKTQCGARIRLVLNSFKRKRTRQRKMNSFTHWLTLVRSMPLTSWENSICRRRLGRTMWIRTAQLSRRRSCLSRRNCCFWSKSVRRSSKILQFLWLRKEEPSVQMDPHLSPCCLVLTPSSTSTHAGFSHAGLLDKTRSALHS